VTVESRKTATEVASIRIVKTSRPPETSVHMPRKIRLMEPVRTGVATRSEFGIGKSKILLNLGPDNGRWSTPQSTR